MTYRRVLFEYGLDHYGFVTPQQAADLGVPNIELAKLARRGWLTNISYGLYRVNDVPVPPNAEYAEAVLRVGEGAFLTHDAVLALHELALVNPARIRVGVDRRVRRSLPDWIELVPRPAPEALTTYEGIPSTTVGQALRDCIGMVPRDRLLDALEDARRRGLVRRRDVPALAAAIEGSENP